MVKFNRGAMWGAAGVVALGTSIFGLSMASVLASASTTGTHSAQVAANSDQGPSLQDGPQTGADNVGNSDQTDQVNQTDQTDQADQSDPTDHSNQTDQTDQTGTGHSVQDGAQTGTNSAPNLSNDDSANETSGSNEATSDSSDSAGQSGGHQDPAGDVVHDSTNEN